MSCSWDGVPTSGLMAGPRAADRQTPWPHAPARHCLTWRPAAFPNSVAVNSRWCLIARALAQGANVLYHGRAHGPPRLRLTRCGFCTAPRLARQGYSILMSSHVPDHAFLVCNKVALLKEGRLHGPGPPAGDPHRRRPQRPLWHGHPGGARPTGRRPGGRAVPVCSPHGWSGGYSAMIHKPLHPSRCCSAPADHCHARPGG